MEMDGVTQLREDAGFMHPVTCLIDVVRVQTRPCTAWTAVPWCFLVEIAASPRRTTRSCATRRREPAATWGGR